MFRIIRTPLAGLLMLVTSLLLAGCEDSSIPPPVVETQTVKVLPPAGLMADIPPPAIPETVATRDDFRDVTIDLAQWGAQLRQRLSDLRDWAAKEGEAQ